jgi:hypothetical protein
MSFVFKIYLFFSIVYNTYCFVLRIYYIFLVLGLRNLGPIVNNISYILTYS